MAFSFSFSGDDIEIDTEPSQPQNPEQPTPFISTSQAAETGSLTRSEHYRSTSTNTAFPVEGQVLLEAKVHSLEDLLGRLPGSISYGELRVGLDAIASDGASVVGEDLRGGNQRRGDSRGERREISLLRRELWDVRVQLMAEADVDGEGGEGEVGLGRDDVKTGVYEGGFKSWESSVDLVRVLEGRGNVPGRVLEMGCGTALPTLSIFQHHLENPSTTSKSLSLTFADYNPSVLYLVTLPNILLTWARHHHYNNPNTTTTSPFLPEGELEITPELLTSFQNSLKQRNIDLNFLSGAWSPDFVEKFREISLNSSVSTSTTTSATGNENENENGNTTPSPLLILAAETIYSPFALQTFTDSLMNILKTEKQQLETPNNNQNPDNIETIVLDQESNKTEEVKQELRERKSYALVAAKKVYFGVGGSMEDFYEGVRERGGVLSVVREEVEGVRRAVAEVRLG